MTYKKYSIVAVPFPFTDSAQTKKRPALVISSEHHQNKTGHITLLMVTSAKHSHWYDDHTIINLSSTGLNMPSIIRQKIFTIDNRLIVRKVGTLDKEDQAKIIDILRQHIFH